MKKIILILFCISISSLLAQDGTLDPSFGDNGITTTDFGHYGDYLIDSKLQWDGKIIGVGGVDTGDGFIPAVARYLEDGDLDPSFGNNGTVTTFFVSNYDKYSNVGLQSNQKILAGGWMGAPSETNYTVARYLENGEIDPNFADNGLLLPILPVGFITKMEVTPADEILFYGQNNSGNNSQITVVKYLPDGDVDNSFGTNGVANIVLTGTGFQINSTKLLADGSTLILASMYNANIAEVVISKFLSNGEVDTTFGTNGSSYQTLTSTEEIVFADAHFDLAPSGDIVITGSFGKCDEFNGMFHPYFIRYLADGNLDSSFGTDGVILFPASSLVPFDIMVQENGRLLVATNFLDCFEGGYVLLKRYFSGGTADTSFSADLLDIDGKQAFFDENGKLLVSGSTWWYNKGTYFALARYNVNVLNTPQNHLQRISIYPNPSNGIFTLKGLQLQLSETPYRVCDISGKIIEKGTLTGTETTIDLSQAQSGIYFLFTAGQNMKLIKQ